MATNATSKTAPAKTAAKTAATPADAAPDAFDLSGVKDGSRFADGTGAAFASALAFATPLVSEYASAADALDGIVRDLTLTETAMRASVLRSDGMPDLAGSTDLWRSVLDARVVSVYREALKDQTRVNRLRSAITSSRSRNGDNAVNAAAFVVKTTPGLGAKKVTVEQDGKKVTRTVSDVVKDAAPGSPIPDVVRAAMDAVYSEQKDAKGKRSRGFESVPKNFGGPSKQPKTIVTPDTSGGTESAWSNLRKDLSSKVTSDAAAEEVLRTATVLADAYLGKPDAKPSADLIKDRAETAKYLRAAAVLLKHLANGVEDADDASAAKAALAEYRLAG